MRMERQLNHRPLSQELIVFGRYPTPGRTKTRLIPTLGPVGAAELHRELMERTVATCGHFCKTTGISMEVCYDGGTRKQFVRWLGPQLKYVPQSEGDLGQRMFRSFVRAFAKGSTRVVLVGTDIPDMNGSHISNAFRALAHHDMVLGPSVDGGYWLIGLTKPVPVFDSVEWSTGKVLDQTTRVAKKQGLDVYRMRPLDDIDTPEDLNRVQGPEVHQPYISVVIPTLNEEKTIQQTIERARSRDAEILVVDGGSSDHTVHLAMEAGATVVHSPQGRAPQLNRGAMLAEGRVLLFLHADTRLPSDYPSLIFETLMDPRTAGGAFRFKTDLDHPFMKLIEAVTFIRSSFLQLPYGDQGLFVRKSLFQEIGGFPEVEVAEEIFFLKQIAKQGRIRTLRTEAVTSARRWRRLGVVRTTWINQLILMGLGLHISPKTLSRLYRVPGSNRGNG